MLAPCRSHRPFTPSEQSRSCLDTPRLPASGKTGSASSTLPCNMGEPDCSLHRIHGYDCALRPHLLSYVLLLPHRFFFAVAEDLSLKRHISTTHDNYQWIRYLVCGSFLSAFCIAQMIRFLQVATLVSPSIICDYVLQFLVR